MKIIFSKVAVSQTATFLKLRYLFLYRHFVLEICLNFYGLVKAAHGDKTIQIGFNFILFVLITIGHTKSILNICFVGGKITDLVNTISVHHFHLKFRNFRRPFIFNLYLSRKKLFSIGLVTYEDQEPRKYFFFRVFPNHNFFNLHYKNFRDRPFQTNYD